MHANIEESKHRLPLCVVSESIAYFMQCRREEMHGDEVEYYPVDREQEESCSCGACMHCVGLSWRDFL